MNHGKDQSFINFLNYAYRSASEVQSLLYVAVDLKYISMKQFDVMYNHSTEIKKLIGGFIQYLKNNWLIFFHFNYIYIGCF